MDSTKVITIISLTILTSIGFAQQATAPAQPPVAPADANSIQAPALPYIAEITSNDVYVRSGPGQNYYFCGKLTRGDKIRVVSVKYSWSQIVPPQGSFSWISKQYVQVDPENKMMGTVVGDAVRVWAGSDAVAPANSASMQVKLDKDDKVSLLGEEKDNYYKIASPEGAYLWVSTDYTKPLTSLVPTSAMGAATAPPAAQPQAELKTELKPAAKPATQPATTPAALAVSPATAPATPPAVDESLKKYNALKEKVEAERAKPIDQQDYTELKKTLSEIAGDKQAGKVAGYAAFVLKQIDRYDLAKKIGQTIKEQDAQTAKTRQGIDQSRDSKLASFDDKSRFAIIGTLETSNILGSKPTIKYFRLVDNSGKTVAYAIPTGPAEILDFAQLLHKKVGLVGTIEPFVQTGGALVKFSEVVEMK